MSFVRMVAMRPISFKDGQCMPLYMYMYTYKHYLSPCLALYHVQFQGCEVPESRSLNMNFVPER